MLQFIYLIASFHYVLQIVALSIYHIYADSRVSNATLCWGVDGRGAGSGRAVARFKI